MRQLWTHLRDHPLQLRLTVLTTAGVALAVILSSLVGYLALSRSLAHASQNLAVTVAEALVGPATQDLTTSGTLTVREAQVGAVVVAVVDTRGGVLSTPGEQRRIVLEQRDRAAIGPEARTVTRSGVSTSGDPYAVAVVPMPGTDHALLVARSLQPVNDILGVQRAILIGVCLAGVATSAGIGLLIARSGLRPIRQLTKAFEHVTTTRDYRPVSVRHAKGDLARMAASFNLMLLSLACVRERQVRCVADAAHELRNPLTSLRTNVDLLRTDLRRDRLRIEEKDTVLRDLDGQLDELGELIGDFVHVLREDTAVKLTQLDFRDVVHTALDRVSQRSRTTTFNVALDPLFLVGNADELVRVVTNLLDNAVKWSPPGGIVRVRLEGNRFRVSDSGPGIPEADLPYVFDRFFRGASGRKVKGTGLGLSIVAKTVEELGGTVAAGRSAEGGAEFTLQLPGVTSKEAVATVLIPALGHHKSSLVESISLVGGFSLLGDSSIAA